MSRRPASAHPALVPAYTAALVGASVLLWRAAGTSRAAGATRSAAVPLLILLVAAGALRLRFQYRDDVEALDLFEAVLVPVLFLFTPGVAILMAAAGKGASQTLLRVEPRKAAFNVAQWMCATAAGAATMSALRTSPHLTGGTLLAVMAATVVVMAVTHAATAVVLRLVGSQRLPEVIRGLGPVIVPGWLIGGAANLALGVIFVAALQWHPWILCFALLPLALLHWAGRAYTEVRIDRQRLAALHHAAQALALPVNPLDAIGAFLAIVRDCFQAEAAEVQLIEDRGVVVYRRNEDGSVVTGRGPGDDGSLAALLIRQGSPCRVDRRTPDVAAAARLRSEGWRDCLAVPLLEGDRPVGLLCTYNRTGLSGFAHGELAILEALALDLRRSLEKSRLVAEVLEERRKLTEIVSRTSDGIATVAADGTVTSWNPAMHAITGHPAETMVGTQRLGVLRPRDADGRDVLLERFAELAQLPATLQILTPTGELRWLSCTYSRIPPSNDQPEQCIVVARDITESHQVERLKQEFVATVSHELRTPLAPILGWATTLLSQAGKLGEDQQRAGLESILRQGQRLERLIVNLLEVSRIEEGTSAATDASLDVVAIANAAVESLSTAWPDRKMVVDAPSQRCVGIGNALWVEQILTNLLSNALKYAPGPEPIIVQITRKAGAVEIAVIDHGPGIPQHLHEKVFERFERFPQVDTQAGTGLGLYIARQLAEAIHARLELHSTVGEGATFTLSLRSPVQLVAVG